MPGGRFPDGHSPRDSFRGCTVDVLVTLRRPPPGSTRPNVPSRATSDSPCQGRTKFLHECWTQSPLGGMLPDRGDCGVWFSPSVKVPSLSGAKTNSGTRAARGPAVVPADGREAVIASDSDQPPARRASLAGSSRTTRGWPGWSSCQPAAAGPPACTHPSNEGHTPRMRYGPKRVTLRFPDGSTTVGALDDLPRVGDSLKVKGGKWRVVRVARNSNNSGFDVWCESAARSAASPRRPPPETSEPDSMRNLGADLMGKVRQVRRWQHLRKLRREGLWR